MKLRDLLSLIQTVAASNKIPTPMIVGGVPRDKVAGILKNEVPDLDITCGSKLIHNLAEEVSIELKKQYNISVKTGDDGHRSIIFPGNEFKLDFSSNFVIPKIDLYLHELGVKNPTDMQRECYSRDFYCNTLLLSLDLKKIKDPTHQGIKDIKNKIIRTCLDPNTTFRFNTNRIIRVIYLAAKLNFDVDPEIIKWISENKDMVRLSSDSYLKKNLDKAMSKNPKRAVEIISKTNLWDVIPITEALQPYYNKKKSASVIKSAQNTANDAMNILDEGLYAHFTDSKEHFGINPNRAKNLQLTGGPNGLYAYEWSRDMLDKMKFAANRSFVVLFHPSDSSKILDIATYTEAQLNTDLNKLRNKVEPLLVDTALKRLDKYTGKFDIFKRTLSSDHNTPGGKLFYVISKMIENDQIDPENPIPYNTPGTISPEYARKLFIHLGYTGFTDRYGVIQTPEPNQTVFFDPSQLKIVGVFDSPWARSGKKVSRSSKIEVNMKIRLYRGMTVSSYNHLMSSRQFSPTSHPGNVASADIETALHWAGQRGDEDDPGLVISFDAPIKSVVEDPIFKGDYRFVASFTPTNIQVIHKDIIGPIGKTSQLKRNFDPGEGFYAHMNEYDSVADFRKKRRDKRKKVLKKIKEMKLK